MTARPYLARPPAEQRASPTKPLPPTEEPYLPLAGLDVGKEQLGLAALKRADLIAAVNYLAIQVASLEDILQEGACAHARKRTRVL